MSTMHRLTRERHSRITYSTRSRHLAELFRDRYDAHGNGGITLREWFALAHYECRRENGLRASEIPAQCKLGIRAGLLTCLSMRERIIFSSFLNGHEPEFSACINLLSEKKRALVCVDIS